MPVARPESSDSRVIAHVDMDCFYVQVEQRKQPHLRGLPTAVVQYNEWQGGALIAVSYEARTYGVKRSMRGHEAKQVCPEIELVQVPVARGKADLNTYRNAGSEVVSILARTGRCERASIDEVYLDLTDAAEKMLAEAPPEHFELVDEETLKSHILGLTNEREIDDKENVREWLCRKDADRRDKLLACGAIIVAELRMKVLKETEFTCSAGIAHNKILAKLASGMNKPAQQTVVSLSSVKGLLDSLPIKKMKQLGGKLGSSLQSDLGVKTVGDLLQFPEEKLQELYGVNTGTWLWNIARGVSGEEVQGRLLPKSHGSGKSFPGPRALKTFASVEHWLNELCEELNERICSDLNQNRRIARTLTLHATAYKSSDSDALKNFPSKSCPLRYGAAKMQDDAMNLFQAGLREYLGCYSTRVLGTQNNGWRITGLSVSASKIVEIPSGNGLSTSRRLENKVITPCKMSRIFRSTSASQVSRVPSRLANLFGLLLKNLEPLTLILQLVGSLSGSFKIFLQFLYRWSVSNLSFEFVDLLLRLERILVNLLQNILDLQVQLKAKKSNSVKEKALYGGGGKSLEVFVVLELTGTRGGSSTVTLLSSGTFLGESRSKRLEDSSTSLTRMGFLGIGFLTTEASSLVSHLRKMISLHLRGDIAVAKKPANLRHGGVEGTLLSVQARPRAQALSRVICQLPVEGKKDRYVSSSPFLSRFLNLFSVSSEGGEIHIGALGRTSSPSELSLCGPCNIASNNTNSESSGPILRFVVFAPHIVEVQFMDHLLTQELQASCLPNISSLEGILSLKSIMLIEFEEEKDELLCPNGTSSIMKYFHGESPSSMLSKQSHDGFVQDADQPSHSGTESSSEINLIQHQINFPGEDTITKGKMPCLDQQDHRKDIQKEQLERRIGELDGLDERVRDLAPNNQNSGPTVTQQQVASLAQDYANLLARVAAIERRDAATGTSGAPQMEDRIKALEQATAGMQAAITVLQNGQAALQDSLNDTIEDCNVSVTAIREELAGIGGGDKRTPESSSSSKSDAATGKKPLKCWLCQGPHRAAACPHQSKLSAIKASIAQEEQGCGEDDEDEDCAHMSAIPCHLPLERGQDDVTQEACLSSVGTESCSGINQSEENKVFHRDEPSGQCGVSSLNRPEQKRKALKEKPGTHSILRFFKKIDQSCPTVKEHDDDLQNVELASTGVGLTERPLEVSDTNNGQCTFTQFEHREAWSYKIDEIDPSVVDELPPEIQDEVRLWLRPLKRSNIAKQGSSIAHYFLPTRKN
ncbi:hypothetical protein F8388_008033 [Cannabis sativa]|uniref:DNA polymerase eta n=1 Tax=Cannabis sativa TaxID=3483 RepID=A0A7J6H803_CANSA|nr:hypothetical protein F8388_008033 [Cannabis sativa]